MAIQTHSVDRGSLPNIQPVRRRAKIMTRILSINAAFDRVAAKRQISLPKGKSLANGHANLLQDQIDSCDHFGRSGSTRLIVA
jgi:hypothetical protein